MQALADSLDMGAGMEQAADLQRQRNEAQTAADAAQTACTDAQARLSRAQESLDDINAQGMY
jgi:hypothetical protein